MPNVVWFIPPAIHLFLSFEKKGQTTRFFIFWAYGGCDNQWGWVIHGRKEGKDRRKDRWVCLFVYSYYENPSNGSIMLLLLLRKMMRKMMRLMTLFWIGTCPTAVIPPRHNRDYCDHCSRRPIPTIQYPPIANTRCTHQSTNVLLTDGLGRTSIMKTHPGQIVRDTDNGPIFIARHAIVQYLEAKLAIAGFFWAQSL